MYVLCKFTLFSCVYMSLSLPLPFSNSFLPDGFMYVFYFVFSVHSSTTLLMLSTWRGE